MTESIKINTKSRLKARNRIHETVQCADDCMRVNTIVKRQRYILEAVRELA